MPSTQLSVDGTEQENMTDKNIEEYIAEVNCFQLMLADEYPDDGRLYCNSTWDGRACWNYTLAGTLATIPCPSYVDGYDTSRLASRQCTEDGTWWRTPLNNTWSNYTSCINLQQIEDANNIINIYVAGYSVSIAFLLVSLAIFIIFRRQLQCDRVLMHENLFVSYVLNGFVWILYYLLVARNVDVLILNPVWCQILHIMTQYLVCCNFFWMFCEGLYLHTLIVVAFTSGKSLVVGCCIVGWGFPVLLVVTYAVARFNSEECANCWINESPLQWIVSGPIIITLLTNLLFMFNIVRVLVTKLRAFNSPDVNQSKKAVRATLILIPLLGLHFILFPVKPEAGTVMENVYDIATALATSTQGMFVAILFCLLNGEVINVIKRKWRIKAFSGKGKRKQTFFTQTNNLSMDDIPTCAVNKNTSATDSSRLLANGGDTDIKGEEVPNSSRDSAHSSQPVLE